MIGELMGSWSVYQEARLQERCKKAQQTNVIRFRPAGKILGQSIYLSLYSEETVLIRTRHTE